jgi:hypothetical protein
VHQLYPGCEGSVKVAKEKGIVWVFLRKDRSAVGQEVPSWAGFTSVTGTKPRKLTSIDYYPVINHPITEYKTVQECLRYAEEASREIGQSYTVTTFDLGVCMKAYPLVWNNPHTYEKHIVMIGTFHLICAYLKMVGKKMAGSGLSDVLLEAGLIGTGSIQGVLKGKHYERAMHCHKSLLESLERLVLEQFLAKCGEDKVFDSLPESSKSQVQNLIQTPSKEMLDQLCSDDAVSSYLKDYLQYRESISDGKLGKTAQFWMAYMFTSGSC